MSQDEEGFLGGADVRPGPQRAGQESLARKDKGSACGELGREVSRDCLQKGQRELCLVFTPQERGGPGPATAAILRECVRLGRQNRGTALRVLAPRVLLCCCLTPWPLSEPQFTQVDANGPSLSEPLRGIEPEPGGPGGLGSSLPEPQFPHLEN